MGRKVVKPSTCFCAAPPVIRVVMRIGLKIERSLHMYILGINAAFHDSSACLIKDGNLLAAAEEERFTHIKHGKRPIPFSTYELPFHAIHYCLSAADIHINEVDHIAYSFDPWLLLDRNKAGEDIALPLEPSAHPKGDGWSSVWDPLFLSSIVNAPRQLHSGYPHHLQARFKGGYRKAKWHFVDHHICHAASAFYVSPFEEAAVMVLDGRGEKATTSYYAGKGNDLVRLQQVTMPHSLGLFYERVTEYLGFLRSSDEYKVMALASFGEPVYADELRSLIHLYGNGLYTIDELQLAQRFGNARERNGELARRHFDIARSLQDVLEETVLELAHWLHETTGLSNLCLAGGVALNCVLNSVVKRKGEFQNIWIQPAAGDAGTSLGAALWVNARVGGNATGFKMEHVYYGPGYTDAEIEHYLKSIKVSYKKLGHVAADTARILAQDKIIGWFQGRMEFGPRALGNRSILASPLNAEMQEKLNAIKEREDFRPVAPSVLEEDAGEWFEKAAKSPFMLFTYDIRPEQRKRIPAVSHVDGTARVQTVNGSQNPGYHELLTAFKEITGVPVLVNTSFNTRGRPVVCTPQDAVACFWTSPLDALVLQSFLLEKK